MKSIKNMNLFLKKIFFLIIFFCTISFFKSCIFFDKINDYNNLEFVRNLDDSLKNKGYNYVIYHKSHPYKPLIYILEFDVLKEKDKVIVTEIDYAINKRFTDTSRIIFKKNITDINVYEFKSKKNVFEIDVTHNYFYDQYYLYINNTYLYFHIENEKLINNDKELVSLIANIKAILFNFELERKLKN